ncbi:hypothetical protein AB4Y45_33995 [Paraburkholderia sp. EG287A]|uniref:hypothetical protein n=1 Tax=Paraburkholderia sp. EG287A TaxID=3237012 RepID=UPI0034D32B0C
MKHPNVTVLRTFEQDQGHGVMYRIEARRVSGGCVDEVGEWRHGESYSRLYAHTFVVLKVTKCGKWIRDYAGDRRFILDTSRKRFAHETIELALASFRARRDRQIGILSARLRAAEEELALAQYTPAKPDLFHMSHAQLAKAAGALA